MPVKKQWKKHHFSMISQSISGCTLRTGRAEHSGFGMVFYPAANGTRSCLHTAQIADQSSRCIVHLALTRKISKRQEVVVPVSL